MLTIGGSPVVPGNSADSFNISEKPRLDAKKIFPGINIKKITENQYPIKEKQILNLKLHRNLYYGYNKVHMKNYEQRMHENGIGDVFGYDAVYRLTNAKFNVPDPTVENPTGFDREKNIFLDHVDNITRIDETKNGETTQITTEIPPDTDFLKLNQYSRFDQWGLGYDKNGNLTQKGTQRMYFDYRDQMVRVTEGTTTTENKYDALGRRLQKIVNTGSQSKTENYYYSGHQVIEVRDGNDQVKRQFIYGNGIDEVIRMDVYNGSTITPYYFHTNAIGSTTAVTDANGQVVERYKYGLYGMPTFMDAAGNVIPKSAIGNNILFQGREYEPETNFYYFRARHIDPIMGRFLQTDPMGYEDSLNLYQAFNQNPVNFTDPFGLQSSADYYGGDIMNWFRRFLAPKIKTTAETATVMTKRAATGGANATVGNIVNLFLWIESDKRLHFTTSDDATDLSIRWNLVDKGKFNYVEEAKNLTVVIPMAERTIEYGKNVNTAFFDRTATTEQKLEAHKYIQLNTAQQALDLFALYEVGTGTYRLVKVTGVEPGGQVMSIASDSKATFIVTPEGQAIPVKFHRYTHSKFTPISVAKSGLLPAKRGGTYVSFDLIDDAIIAQSKTQIPYRPDYRISGYTIDVLDNMKIPKGQWGVADYLEPITKDFRKFGPGKATQIIIEGPVPVDPTTFKKLR
jgi:RHS repeat-associated protein